METVLIPEVQSSTITKYTPTTSMRVSVQATKTAARGIKLSQPVTNNKVSSRGSKSIFGYPRSVVKHTSEWIPGSFGPHCDVVFKNTSGSFVT